MKIFAVTITHDQQRGISFSNNGSSIIHCMLCKSSRKALRHKSKGFMFQPTFPKRSSQASSTLWYGLFSFMSWLTILQLWPDICIVMIPPSFLITSSEKFHHSAYIHFSITKRGREKSFLLQFGLDTFTYRAVSKTVNAGRSIVSYVSYKRQWCTSGLLKIEHNSLSVYSTLKEYNASHLL